MSALLLCVLLALAAGEPDLPGAKAIFENPGQGVLTLAPTPGIATKWKPAPETAADPMHERHGADYEILERGTPATLPFGVRYWVQMLDNAGRPAGEVQAGRVFRHGDRIQILAESNTDGYLVVLHIGSDGSSGLLFPSAEHRLTDNRVAAYQRVVLPGPRHFFRFDRKPGIELLVLVLSRDPSDLEGLRLDTKMERQLVEAVRAHGARERGAKNLVVEELPETAGDPATYAAIRSGGMLVQEIALFHQP